MKIYMPCELGEYGECEGKLLQFMGVTWFKWQRGIEFTYFFNTGNKWSPTTFYSTFNTDNMVETDISDILLEDILIKERGFPVKGKGYVNGLYWKDGKKYVNFIATDIYNAHIRVECDKNNEYPEHGRIIFPTSWDEAKKEKYTLRSIVNKKSDAAALMTH